VDTLNNQKYTIHLINSEEDAKKAVEFFLSEFSFDDRNFTPGELEHMKTCTLDSLKEKNFYYWCAKNSNNEIIGLLGVRENEQKTGGYIGDFCVIHRNYRKEGLALKMHEVMFNYLKSIGARYLLIETCDTDYYKPIRKLLLQLGFRKIGHCPHYYYENEGLIWYLKRFDADKK